MTVNETDNSNETVTHAIDSVVDAIVDSVEHVKNTRHLLQFNGVGSDNVYGRGMVGGSKGDRGDVMEEYNKFKERKSHRAQLEEASRLEEASKSRAGFQPMRHYHPTNSDSNSGVGSSGVSSVKSSSYGGCEVVIVCAADDAWRSLLMNWYTPCFLD